MRYFVSLIVGIGVSLGLFLIMHSMISGQQVQLSGGAENIHLVDFVRVPHQETTQTKNRATPKKPQPTKQPPPTHVKVAKVQNPHAQQPNINMPKLDVPLGGAGGSGPYLGAGGNQFSGGFLNEGQAIPLVEIEPQYPREALLNGLEGQVTLEFVVRPDGEADEPRVIKTTNHIFNQAAIRALLRSKFKPTIVNGKAISQKATFTYVFRLPKDKRR